jgi:hypothetical protein
MTHDQEPDNAADQARKDALIQQALLAFERDVEQFLPAHVGEWVAYHGDKQVGFAKARDEICQACLRSGVPEGEFWVFYIQPLIGEEFISSGGLWCVEE